MSGFDELDAAMDAHKQKKESQQVDAKAAEKARDRFLTEYDVFAQTQASLMFQHVGNKLCEGGHDFHVEYHPESYTLTLDVFIDSTRADHFYGSAKSNHPKVTMQADVPHKKVFFSSVRTQGGSVRSGPEGGLYSLDEVTADVVRQIAVSVITDSLK